jgi:iron complex outermembrane receptor protein
MSISYRHAFYFLLAAHAPLTVHAGGAAAVRDLASVPLEQLLTMDVYSASRFVQKSREAPSSVTVITAADIRRFGWRTLGDVARSVRGLHVHYDRSYSYLGARGFMRPGDYNSRFLLQVDGIRINDTIYDQAPVGNEFPLDLDLIERIEFVPGPGSSIYGSSAFFGVINVITRQAPASRATVEAGSAGARKAMATFSSGGLTLSASGYRSRGRDLYYAEYDNPDENFGRAEGMDGERGQRLFARAQFGELRLTAIHARRAKTVPTGSFEQLFNDPRSVARDRQTYVDLDWTSERGPEEWTARLFAGRYFSYGTYPFDRAERAVNDDYSDGRWVGAEAKVVSTRWKGHKLVAGAEWHRDRSLEQVSYDIDPYFSYLDLRTKARRSGIYIQDEVALASNLIANLGVRHDRISGIKGVFSPRAALIWQLDEQTTVKAIHGSAYRAPNSYEKFYEFTGPGGQLANPALRKERIVSSELSLVRQVGERSRLTATVFNNVVHDLITQVIEPHSGMPQFQNSSRLTARGVELEAEYAWSNGAQLRASYAARKRISGPYVAPQAALPASIGLAAVAAGHGSEQQHNAPLRNVRLNLVAPRWGNWTAAFEAQLVGPRWQLTGGRTPSHLVANLNAVADFGVHTRLSFGVYNLFDRQYSDPASVEHRQSSLAQDGRMLRVQLSRDF